MEQEQKEPGDPVIYSDNRITQSQKGKSTAETVALSSIAGQDPLAALAWEIGYRAIQRERFELSIAWIAPGIPVRTGRRRSRR